MARARLSLVSGPRQTRTSRGGLLVAISISVATMLTPVIGEAQQLDRLAVGVRRPDLAISSPLVISPLLQDAPRATPTRHVVTGAIIGGLVGVVVRRSTANCDAETLSSLCRDSATLGGLTVGAATGAVVGLVVWIVRNPRPPTTP